MDFCDVQFRTGMKMRIQEGIWNQRRQFARKNNNVSKKRNEKKPSALEKGESLRDPGGCAFSSHGRFRPRN